MFLLVLIVMLYAGFALYADSLIGFADGVYSLRDGATPAGDNVDAASHVPPVPPAPAEPRRHRSGPGRVTYGKAAVSYKALSDADRARFAPLH